VEIRDVDPVVVRERNSSDARLDERESRGAPETARSDDEGAFAGQGNQRTKQNSARGNKSMNRSKGGGGRPPRASGGRR